MDFGKHRARGVTLVELATVVAIVGITVSLAAPAFNRLMARNAMASSVNLFLAQLHLARSSAVTRERRITLCPATDPSSCNDDHRAWHGGYLIFQNDNRNRELDASEELISYEEPARSRITIVSSSKYRNRISYRAMGRAWFSNTTVRFCHPDYPELNRAIIVSNNGRARVVKKLGTGKIDCT